MSKKYTINLSDEVQEIIKKNKRPDETLRTFFEKVFKSYDISIDKNEARLRKIENDLKHLNGKYAELKTSILSLKK